MADPFPVPPEGNPPENEQPVDPGTPETGGD